MLFNSKYTQSIYLRWTETKDVSFDAIVVFAGRFVEAKQLAHHNKWLQS